MILYHGSNFEIVEIDLQKSISIRISDEVSTCPPTVIRRSEWLSSKPKLKAETLL